jgi:hypothetical protein
MTMVVLVAVVAAGSFALGRWQNPSSPNSDRVVIALSAASTEFFFGNQAAGLNCEFDTANAPSSSYATMAYCQSVTPSQSASLNNSGPATICKGQGCIGNPGLGTPTFPTNSVVTLGNASCYLDADKVRCVRGSHGFVLALDKKLNRHW